MKTVLKIYIYTIILTIAIITGSHAESIIPGFRTRTKIVNQKVKRTKETTFYARRFGKFHRDKYFR